MLWMLWIHLATASPLDAMLDKGLVSTVELQEDGRLQQVTAIVRIHASADQVWGVLIDFDRYTEWMPRVARSEVTKTEGSSRVVDLGISVPGPNVRFDVSYDLDQRHRTLRATALSGAVQGGKWDFRVEPEGNGCLVYRTTYASAVVDNWIIRQFDDDTHAIELGLNAATPLIELQGLKKEAERQ